MKYSKPSIREFGFNSKMDCMNGSSAGHDFSCGSGNEVGTECKTGASNANTCVDGPLAVVSCDMGGDNFDFDGCIAGNSPLD